MGRLHVFVLDVLEEFELAVCSFAQNGCAEGFHDLLNRNGCAGELISGRAGGAG